MAHKGTLKKGDILNSKIVNDISCENNPVMTRQLQEYYTEQFPKGVCNHGEMYFAYGGRFTYLHPFTELVIEKARKGIDTSLPSRANAIFALDNPNKFQELCSLMKVPFEDVEVWEVEGESYFKADMFLLDTIQRFIFSGSSILAISKLADDYWRGNSISSFIENDKPFWEYLVEPPIFVKEKYLPI